ncbi:MAG: RNA-binding domain-containing protein [Thermoplasmata archaeon]
MEFRAHGHATENNERVLKAFAFVTGIEKPTITRAEGYHGNPIAIFTASLEDSKSIRAFWERVREAGELEAVLKDLDRRVDEDCQLHLRFDKQEAYQGRLKVVRHDDIISMKAKVAAYPARRDKAVQAVIEYFRED